MKGSSWGETVASLHIPLWCSSGLAATLYMPLAVGADPECQDLVVLTALVAMQQEFIGRKHAAASGAAIRAG